jgi:hypothetical protein
MLELGCDRDRYAEVFVKRTNQILRHKMKRMKNLITAIVLITIVGCTETKVPTPDTDPNVIKKLEGDVDAIQKKSGEGKQRKNSEGK